MALRKYSPVELAAMAIGQSGFDIIAKAYDAGATDEAEEKEGSYLSVQNISNAGALVQIQSINAGSDFAVDGTYLHHETSSTNYITISAGDTIHGNFDKISLYEPASGTSTLKLGKG